MLPKIGLGADHRGYRYKELLKDSDISLFVDFGAFSSQQSNYPDYAKAVCQAVLAGEVDAGVLFCGSGAGMVIAANRYPGIYAAVAWNSKLARVVREDDWCNVLVIPADYVQVEDVYAIISAWQSAEPKEGRYRERLEIIDQ